MNAYEYLFYRLYRWSERVNGENFFNTYSASLMISLPIWANIFAGLMLMSLLSGARVDFDIVPYSLRILVVVVFFFVQYVYFKVGGRDKKILSRYKNENPNESKIRGYFVFSYVVGSITAPIVLGLTFLPPA